MLGKLSIRGSPLCRPHRHRRIADSIINHSTSPGGAEEEACIQRAAGTPGHDREVSRRLRVSIFVLLFRRDTRFTSGFDNAALAD